MPSLSQFTDFMNMTPPVYVTSPREMMNDAIVQAPLLGRLLVGRDPQVVIRGGQDIRDTVILTVVGNYGSHGPGDPVGGYSNEQASLINRIRWKMNRGYMTWTEGEILLNVPEGLTAEAQTRLFKSLKYGKESVLWTNIFNGMDAQLLADPHSAAAEAAMEGENGLEPLSLAAIIPDTANGVPLGWAGPVANINAATEANWRPVRTQYDFADPDDTDGDNDGLLDAFERTFLDLQFMPPPIAGTEEYFKRTGRDPNLMFIAGSNRGVAFYKRRLLERNDTLANQQDPAYVSPKYAGVQVVQVSGLGTASLYGSAAGTTGAELTPGGTAAAGHRFYFIDGNALCPVIHSSNFFERMSPMILQDQPDTAVQIVKVWWNLFPKSRRRLGLVAPGA